MTLLKLRNTFKKELETIYSQSEIESIFGLTALDILEMDKASVILDGNKKIAKQTINSFQLVLKHLKNNEPIQYILGKTVFYNLSFKVDNTVLIPRPETEELVDWILKNTQKKRISKTISVLDIGTGSGCIAISLAKNMPNADVWALDVSSQAIAIAQENAIANNVTIHFIEQDILSSQTLPRKFDVIVSNPPYVRSLEKKLMHDNVTLFEPDLALYVTDSNPLLFYDKIADLSLKYLKKEGALFFEINQYIANETLDLLKGKGISTIVLRKDFLGNDRMILARPLQNR